MAEFLKKEISEFIRENVGEQWGIITVMAVILSEDLKQAKVYISCLEEQNKEKVLKILAMKIPEIQHFLGRHLQLRYTPKINFVPDESIEKVNKIEELLKRIKDGS